MSREMTKLLHHSQQGGNTMTVSNLAYLFSGRKFASVGVNVARPFIRESLSLLFCLFLLCDVSQADAWRTLVKTVSKAAGLAEDVPLRKLDDLKAVAKREELVREAIESKLGRKILGTADEVQHLAR